MFNNHQSIKIFKETLMKEYYGKTGQSWVKMSLYSTASETFFKIDFFDHIKDIMEIDFFKNKKNAIKFFDKIKSNNKK